MANVKTPFDEPDLDSRSLFLYDPSSRAIDDHIELASPSSIFFFLKTVAQPTFMHDHGTPELELHVQERSFYVVMRTSGRVYSKVF